MEAEKISSGERIRINIPDMYKRTDDTVWEELENYIFQGFLITRATILNQEFVFKTLNHHEIRTIRQTQPINMTDEKQKSDFRASFIANSIYMVAGENVLYERPKHIRRLIRTISKIPAKIQDSIIEKLSYLNEKSSRLHPLVEVYAYEPKSRFKWMYVQDSPVHSSQNTGIHGTENLGMNYCQQTWLAISRMMDKREVYDHEWSNAKFIGSCFAGKGIRAIDEKDKSRTEKERTEREELKAKVLYEYLNRGTAKEGPALDTYRLPDGRTAKVESRFKADTVEELAKELESALNEEKDQHDIAIEKHIASMNIRNQELEKTKHDWLKSPVMEEMQDMIDAGGGSRVIGGRDKAEEYLKRMRAMRQEQMEKNQLKLEAGQEPSDGSPPNEE